MYCFLDYTAQLGFLPLVLPDIHPHTTGGEQAWHPLIFYPLWASEKLVPRSFYRDTIFHPSWQFLCYHSYGDTPDSLLFPFCLWCLWGLICGSIQKVSTVQRLKFFSCFKACPQRLAFLSSNLNKWHKLPTFLQSFTEFCFGYGISFHLLFLFFVTSFPSDKVFPNTSEIWI